MATLDGVSVLITFQFDWILFLFNLHAISCDLDGMFPKYVKGMLRAL